MLQVGAKRGWISVAVGWYAGCWVSSRPPSTSGTKERMDLSNTFGITLDMARFAPGSAVLGGVLIGTAAALLLAFNGRIAGVSGIVAQSIVGENERGWRVAFVAGLVLGGLGLALASPERFTPPQVALPLIALAGVLVGLGTQIGTGCTSGHGICGLARGSVRSLVAVATFMTAGAIAVLVERALS